MRTSRCSAPARPTAGRTRTAPARPAPPHARPGRLRSQTSALLDGTLLLDCGPETPHAAQRAGLDLTGLRHVLLTHAHPDHCAPAFLLFRSWVSADEPLDVRRPGRRRRAGPDVAGPGLAGALPDRRRAGRPAQPRRVRRPGARRRGTAPGRRVLFDVTAPSAAGCSTPPTPARCPTHGRGGPRRGVRRAAAGGDLRRPRHARHRPPRPGDVPRAAAPAPRGRRGHRRHRRRRRSPVPPQPAHGRARPSAGRLGRPGRRRRHDAGPTRPRRRAARHGPWWSAAPAPGSPARPSGCWPPSST